MATRVEAKSSKPPRIGTISTQGMISVKVGPEQVVFSVHKALLTHHSEYFRRALSRPWKEAQDGVVKLDDIEPAIFAIFVEWLYHQDLPSKSQEWQSIYPREEVSHQSNNQMLFECIKAYAISVRFVAIPFGRAVVKRLNKISIWDLSDEQDRKGITYAFENIPDNRIVLEYLVELYCENVHEVHHDYGLAAVAELPSAFTRRVMLRLAKALNEGDEINGEDRCYLEHENDAEKAACEKQHMTYDEEYCVAMFK